jgi:hypothetical protein
LSDTAEHTAAAVEAFSKEDRLRTLALLDALIIVYGEALFVGTAEQVESQTLLTRRMLEELDLPLGIPDTLGGVVQALADRPYIAVDADSSDAGSVNVVGVCIADLLGIIREQLQ